VDLAPVLTGCHICREPQVELINGWMKARVPDTEIERRLRAAGTPYSRNTLGKHRHRHLMNDYERTRKAAADSMRKQQKTLKGPPTGDLLHLVRDNVYGRLAKGDLEPSIGDGLRAQIAIDQRAEKGADREVLMHLAQVLGGATPIGYIEGEFRVVDPEAEADYEELRLLGSGN
jgi:hypothetical protein